MIAYKLVRKLKNGEISPLFINKKLRITTGAWMKAEAHETKGFAFRPGWHCTSSPVAPHLSEKDRVWMKVEITDYTEVKRPESQGGLWYLANNIKFLNEI